MSFTPYVMLFTDQNTNREFLIQPYTTNGPATPTGGIDPSAAGANTTLFLYGKGADNYGERIQEDMIYVLENFFNPSEPSFPIPGQMWCKSSANELTTPFQLYVFNPRKYSITSSSTNNIYVVSDDGSESTTTVLARFVNLGLAKQFSVYDSVYNTSVFVQTATAVISGLSVMLTVSPATPVGGLVGQYVGGWEEMYQGNCEVVLRRPFNAGNFNIINLATPVNAQDAATKAYVDSAVGGGTIYLANLADVMLTGPTAGQVLTFNGTKWINQSLGSVPFLPLSGGTMTGVINMGGNIITNLPLPANPFDAANKTYVDNQPLSGTHVTITAPNNLDLLVYNSGLSQWVNSGAIAAGVVPISGGITFTGPISMGSEVLTGLVNPVNPTDAVNLQYLNAALAGGGSGVVTGGTFNNVTGTLTLIISGPFAPVNVTGFLPTPNNQVPAPEVAFVPQNPSSYPIFPTNQFFASVLGDATIIGPYDTQDPINVLLHAALNQVDVALGNFVVSRQRLVTLARSDGGLNYDINNGAGLSPLTAPGKTYIKGSENLAVFVNGVKQVASTSANATITGVTIGGTYAVTITPAGIVFAGNVARVFHSGVQFSITGSVSSNGNYISTGSTFSLPNTLVTAIPNGYNPNGAVMSFVADTGNVVYSVTQLREDMETGYTAAVKSLSITANTAAPVAVTPVTISINPTITNISNLGLLRDAINSLALSYYLNAIVAVGGLSFTVPGNRVAQFPNTATFTVGYSGTANDGATFTVSGTPTYNSGPNTTTIPTTTSPVATVKGVLLQNGWGFSMSLENGNVVFHSTIPGSTSSVSVVDPGVGAGLFSGINGVTWPIVWTTPTSIPSNVFTPTDYAYFEVGMRGYLSSLFVFNTSLPITDTVEIIIDREMVYINTNPLAAATIA